MNGARRLRSRVACLTFLTVTAAWGLSACSASLPVAPTPPTQGELLSSVQTSEGRYLNPKGSPTVSNTWRDHVSLWWWASFGAKDEELRPPVPAGHVLPTDQALAMLAAQGAQDSLTWLGHAAFLIRLGGRTLLVDPFLNDYASPIDGIGPRRYAGPAITVDKLPPIDVLVISHNHYDHLDLRALRQLPGKEKMHVIVPAGLGGLLRETGFSNITEMKWGDSLKLDGLNIVSVPAVHFSSRGLFDQDKSLWSGYVFESPQKRVYFAGDTAYHDTLFKQLRATMGPIDVALVPIGAYEPHNMMAHVHVTPEEAVALGRDMGAATLVGMHWGTLVVSTEPPFEPPRRFRAEGLAQGYADKALWAMAIGETRALTSVTADRR
ncbi:MBL fold metallo-hydrolase [Variovorax sp. ZS18.2.2]|uniref:MBL fold metallo-hydrolase n=1 Tax=Variovorax sp. ZS18.2.2 TaxID=2971255 RepID=UPI0021512E7B|nr:MBL fold metallo-hydrolase [Variovorax sp. ZS18.2.2]MCR6478520.1 MBL fold metallo-hydrolase [Variovorax sp. ZS18.2.2]